MVTAGEFSFAPGSGSLQVPRQSGTWYIINESHDREGVEPYTQRTSGIAVLGVVALLEWSDDEQTEVDARNGR